MSERRGPKQLCPLVTIAIPTYNGERYLAETMLSAQGQSYPNIEIMVIDDASIDGTLDIVRDRSSADARVRLVQNAERLGMAGNFSACLTHARGAWVKFLLQDDLLSPTCVEQMVDARVAGCPLIVCGRRYQYDDVNAGLQVAYEGVLKTSLTRLRPEPHWLAPEELFGYVVRHRAVNFIGEPVAIMVERQAALDAGPFDARLLQLMDLEFAVRLGLRYGVTIVPEVLATFRCHSHQATARHSAERAFHHAHLDPALYLATLAYSPRYAGPREHDSGLAEIARDQLSLTWWMSRRPLRRGPRDGDLREQWRCLIREDPIIGSFIESDRQLLWRRAVLQCRMLPPRARGMVAAIMRLHPRGEEAVGRLQAWRRQRTREGLSASGYERLVPALVAEPSPPQSPPTPTAAPGIQ
jgi:hypothetical protein